MKLTFSLLLLVLPIFSNAQLIKIHYIFDLDAAISIADIFQKQYSIPNGLISISKSDNCFDEQAHFCLNEFSELKISIKDQEAFKKSLSSFEIKKKVSYDY